MADWMATLPVTLVEVRLVPRVQWPLPPRPGVMLRGALLRALTDICCVDPRPTGCACPAWHDCPMSRWWRPGGTQMLPWWLSSDPPGTCHVGPDNPLHVGIGAVGPLPRPTALVEAIIRMGRRGLGRERVPHQVQQMVVRGAGPAVQVVVEGRVEGAWPDPGSLSHLAGPTTAGDVTVHLVSPFALPRRPSAAAWMASAIGRVRGLARRLDHSLPVRWPSPQSLPGHAQVWRSHAARTPRSQRGRVDLSGWLGSLTLPRDAAAPFADLIAAAEVLQVGRHVTSGLGAVEVQWT